MNELKPDKSLSYALYHQVDGRELNMETLDTRLCSHVVEGTIDLKTGKIEIRQYTLKEDAIHAIKRQPYF